MAEIQSQVESPLKQSIRRRAENHVPLLKFDERYSSGFKSWKQEVLARFREVLRLAPGPGTVTVRTESVEELDTLTREKIWIRTEPDLEVPAYLLIPRNAPGPLPAILSSHGHGNGKIEVAGVAPSIYGCKIDSGLQFARNGFVTLCPDHRGFGEMSYRESGADEGWLAYHYHTTGATLQGKRVYDLMGCLDYLVTRPEVDANRIGAAGLSLGAEMSYHIGLLDDRIKAVVCSGIIRDVLTEVVDTFHCPCSFTPRLFEYFDFPDLAGALAPKPLMIQTGSRDQCCYRLYQGHGKDRIEAAYASAGASEHLHFDLHNEGHDFLMPGPLAFMRKYL